MFCDGKCNVVKETEEGTLVQKCGLLRTLIQKDKQSGKINEFEMCIFEAIMNSSHRLEDLNLSTVQTIQEQRNDGEDQSIEISKTIAQGFLGVIYSMDDPEKKMKVVKMLKEVGQRVKESEIEIEHKGERHAIQNQE